MANPTAPTESPLSQSVTRDGKAVRVDIYGDGEGGWLLEVVDEFGNSTVWDDSFSSDRDALDEALRTIKEDGIDALIGLPERPEMLEADQALSEDELNELDDFLAEAANEDTSMDVSTLEGFLTAIAIGPRLVRPSEWLPWVWDMEDGEATADFEDQEQASRIMSHIMRLYNSVVQSFLTDPTAFEPIFWRGNQWGAAEWSEGFLSGFQFSDEAWGLLAAGQPTWFTPFLRLGTDDGIEITKKEGNAERWMNEIEPSLVRIHAYWADRREKLLAGQIDDDYHHRGRQKEFGQVIRGGPKIGRNDPCPCGSGKKFKRCCGADGVPPSLH